MPPIRPLTKTDAHAAAAIIRQHAHDSVANDAADLITNRHDDPHFLGFCYETDNTIRGIATGIIYPPDTDPAEYDLKRPLDATYPDGTLVLLRHVYIDDNWRGQGIGKQLSQHLLDTAATHLDADGAFGEAWIKDKYRSSEELFQTLGFTQVHYSEDYFDNDEFDPDAICNGCDRKERNCQCAGAIYVREL